MWCDEEGRRGRACICWNRLVFSLILWSVFKPERKGSKPNQRVLIEGKCSQPACSLWAASVPNVVEQETIKQKQILIQNLSNQLFEIARKLLFRGAMYFFHHIGSSLVVLNLHVMYFVVWIAYYILLVIQSSYCTLCTFCCTRKVKTTVEYEFVCVTTVRRPEPRLSL